MSYLERLRERIAETRYPSQPTKPTQPGFDGFVGEPSRHVLKIDGVPTEIAAGIGLLKSQPPPLITRPDVWPGIVTDAEAIVTNGWCAKAIALGWSALDLFGACADVGHDDDQHGLTVWLSGRPLIAINDRVAVARDRRGHAIFLRRERPSQVLLWELRDVQRARMKGIDRGR